MKNIILFAFIACLLSSCITYQRCIDKYGSYAKDTVFVQFEKKVIVHDTIKADSLSTVVKTDTLRPGQIYTQTDSSGLQIQYWVNAYNNLLNIKATQPQRIIHDTLTIIEKVPCPPVAVFNNKPGKIKGAWLIYCKYAGIFLPLIALFLFLLKTKH